MRKYPPGEIVWCIRLDCICAVVRELKSCGRRVYIVRPEWVPPDSEWNGHFTVMAEDLLAKTEPGQPLVASVEKEKE